ncbi:MAG: beta-ketoacyl synthase N-terminal-like domain-containing protein, partial [Planctomycetota bacterium]|nr:beta-ketoacyl synthase N-terminal-like domain-containing protein [Planctomycetota bacterium]
VSGLMGDTGDAHGAEADVDASVSLGAYAGDDASDSKSVVLVLSHVMTTSTGRVETAGVDDGVDGSAPIPFRWFGVDDTSYDGVGPRFAAMSSCRWESFDCKAFRITQAECVQMDPCQRVVLEHVHCVTRSSNAGGDSLVSILGAGGSSNAVRDRCVGVFAAATMGGENGGAHAVTGYSATSSAGSVVCGRVSYVFNFTGASVSVDTACSASLVATSLALADIDRAEGATSFACVTGVTHNVHSSVFISFGTAGMLAGDGRCKTLDASADGYARADGCAAAVLGSASACPAEAADLAVVLCGAAVNQDGRSSSLTAPNGPSQQSVIASALRRSRVDPSVVGTLQMHGTGTPLGDPIETGAARAVLREGGSAASNSCVPLAFGAAKAVHGHTELVAGLVGVVRAVECAAGAQVDRLLHLRNINEHVASALSGSEGPSGIALPRETGCAPAAHADSVCCVSAFAFQGTNAHALVRTRHCADGARVRFPSGSSWRAVAWEDVHVLAGRSAVFALRASAAFEVGADGPSTAVVHMSTGHSGLSYMHDYRVQHRAILPGAGFVEMVMAGAQTLSSCRAGAVRPVLVHAVSFVAPLPLSEPTTVSCQLDAGGGVRVRAAADRSSEPTTHVQASIRVSGGVGVGSC